MQRFIFLFFFVNSILFTGQAQDTFGTTVVDSYWAPGTITLPDGTVLEGEVRGYLYNGPEVKSFRFRTAKGETATTYKAEDCHLVVYDGLSVLSLPKNPKKPSGKRLFYVALYHGTHFSLLQDPKAKSVQAGGGNVSLNLGQNLSFLGLKDGGLHKISRLSFKKQLQKLLGDNPQWAKKAKDKKWFKYNNLVEIAQFYDETAQK